MTRSRSRHAPPLPTIEPLSINEHGQITGYGTYQGEDRAFPLTPIPEPATILLLGAGIAGLLLRKCARKQN